MDYVYTDRTTIGGVKRTWISPKKDPSIMKTSQYFQTDAVLYRYDWYPQYYYYAEHIKKMGKIYFKGSLNNETYQNILKSSGFRLLYRPKKINTMENIEDFKNFLNSP